MFLFTWFDFYFIDLLLRQSHSVLHAVLALTAILWPNLLRARCEPPTSSSSYLHSKKGNFENKIPKVTFLMISFVQYFWNDKIIVMPNKTVVVKNWNNKNFIEKLKYKNFLHYILIVASLNTNEDITSSRYGWDFIVSMRNIQRHLKSPDWTRPWDESMRRKQKGIGERTKRERRIAKREHGRNGRFF